MLCMIASLLILSTLLSFGVSAVEPTYRDVEYATVDSVSLKLDVYLPNTRTNGAISDQSQPVARPVIVWIHGGAWKSGSKADVPITPLLSAGFAIASVDYRLSPVAPFPAQLHDIKAAIRFLRANHQRFQLDADRFVMAGSSAGGHLAALAGVTDRVRELEGNLGHADVSSRVQAIVSFYGASNLQTILAQSTPYGLNVRIPALELFLGGQPDAKPELAKLASPVAHVDSSDPPLWLFHGDQDPQMPINQAHELYGAYQRANLPVSFEVLHYAKHGGPEFFQEQRLRTLSTELLHALAADSTSGARNKVDASTPDDGLRASVHQLSPEEFASLPSIHAFRDQPSDQFLIPWKDLRSGHPYLGVDAMKPHTGAHLYFKFPEIELDESRPESYPPIYAVADGIVTRVDQAFRLRPVYFPSLDTTRANLRYGVDITFAKSGNHPVSFHYSIEPMVDPGSLDFYKPFIWVTAGQHVRKGDVIATMYLPPDLKDAENSHIHFNLNCDRNFQAPSIFTNSVNAAFSAVWEKQRLREDWPIPACMGWRLGSNEDPFLKD